MKSVPDYRCDREKPHDLAEMLTYLTAGYLNGRVSVGRALCWCEDNIGMLKKHMVLKQGIASEATISRMLNGIDCYMFMYAFMEWTAEILYEHGIHIIIDGKALKGAAEKIKNGNTPYILNAIDAASQMVVGQLPIDEKTNEITAIPKLLEMLKGSKNNLSVIRKFAYNILRIAIIREHPAWGIQRIMDYFSTHLELTEKMLFTPIPSFY